MAKTEHANYATYVKESLGGQPWLRFELVTGEHIPALQDLIIGIELREGVTIEQARQLSEQIRELSTGLKVITY